MKHTEPANATWTTEEHRRGDRYIAVCHYPQGSLENWHSEIVWCGAVWSSRALAWRQGCRETGADDFNIAVLRSGRCVAWLWNDEVIDEDAAFLDEITHKLAAAGVGGTA